MNGLLKPVLNSLYVFHVIVGLLVFHTPVPSCVMFCAALTFTFDFDVSQEETATRAVVKLYLTFGFISQILLTEFRFRLSGHG